MGLLFLRRIVMMRLGLFVVLLSVSLILSAKGDMSDSLRVRTFRPQQLIAPTLLVTVGAIGVSNGWLSSVKKEVRGNMHHMRGNSSFRADDYVQYLPVAANLGLGFLGVKAKHPFRERLVVSATAYATMALIVNVTKVAVGENRPGSTARNSFPSGHTATAFTGAELLREEYGNWYGLGAYALATGVAFLRLYNDRHWLNDVLAGAGVGILSARIGYWLLPCERRLFGWEKKQQDMVILPAYMPVGHSAGLSFAACF